MEAKDPLRAMREANAHARDLSQKARTAATTLRDLLTPEEWAELREQAAQSKAIQLKPETKH